MEYLLTGNKKIVAAITITAILSGIVRIFSYKVGYYVLLATLVSYFIFRILYFILTLKNDKRLNKVNKQHFAIFVALVVIVIFNNFDLLNTPFLSLAFLMMDYLVSLQPFENTSKT